jgi:hypothetical protein
MHRQRKTLAFTCRRANSIQGDYLRGMLSRRQQGFVMLRELTERFQFLVRVAAISMIWFTRRDAKHAPYVRVHDLLCARLLAGVGF